MTTTAAGFRLRAALRASAGCRHRRAGVVRLGTLRTGLGLLANARDRLTVRFELASAAGS